MSNQAPKNDSSSSQEKEKLWTEQEAADYLNLSVQTMRHRRVQKQPPTYLKLGRTVRYRKSDLDACLTEHKAEPAVDEVQNG